MILSVFVLLSITEVVLESLFATYIILVFLSVDIIPNLEE